MNCMLTINDTENRNIDLGTVEGVIAIGVGHDVEREQGTASPVQIVVHGAFGNELLIHLAAEVFELVLKNKPPQLIASMAKAHLMQKVDEIISKTYGEADEADESGDPILELLKELFGE